MDKQLSKNLITNIISMVISLGINYLITPYITKQLGIAAYSYVSIITNIISFFTVITYTLNSMVGRFYTIAYNENEENSNQYISTALYCCFGLAIILLPIIILMTLFLDKLIVIENYLTNDVKFAFFISSLTFLLSTISSVVATGTYAKNKLQISNYIGILANSAKAIIIFALFYIFSAKIWFIGLGGFTQNIIAIILGYISFKYYIPNVKFRIKYFRKDYAKQLLSAGVFNSVIMLGNNLMTQIDLIVGNRYIQDSELIGKYAVILLFSNTIRQISSAISSAFSPTTIKLYAQKKYDELIKYTNNSVSFCGTMLGLIIPIIATLLVPFVGIWLQEDFSSLKYLIVFMLIPLIPNLAITQLNVLNQAVNKLKIPAIASITAGVINIILALEFVNRFKLGIFGIALASVISFTLRNLIFIPLYAAYITKQKWYIYYKPLIKSFLISIIICIVSFVIQRYYVINSIIDLFIIGIILMLIYGTISYLTLNKNDKKAVKKFIKKYVNKKD